MRSVRLSEICDISSGGTPSRKNAEFFNGEIPWAKISDIENADDGVIYNTEERISTAGLKNIRGKLFPKGTLLFAMYGSIGKVAICGRELSTNQAILGIRPKRENEIDLGYLKTWFASNKQKLINQGRGVALKNLSATIIRDLEIKLPPYNDQIRIAHLLGKVEGLVAQRKQHLQQLDNLLKSVFLEMFSPSSDGYDDWPLVEIKDLAEKHKGAMRTGPFGSNLLHSEFTDDGDVAVLGIDNAVQNKFTWSERRFITNEKYEELKNYRIFPCDVIVTIMGTIGRSAVIPENIPLAINTKHLAAITLNKKIANPLFVSYSIHSSPYILNQFKSKNRGAIMSGLNLGLIKETKLKRPPIGIQNKFAEIHKKVDEVKNSYQQSLSNLETLYGALSQQAFKGELDLSRVPLPDENEKPKADESAQENIEISIPLTDFFQIPAAAQTADVTTKEGRSALLKILLSAWVTQFSQKPFVLDDFVATAQNQFWKLTDGEYQFGIEDYETIKNWVFEALESGKLKQERNQFYCVIETKETVLGNLVELKAGEQR